jgi:hypothetical protein
MAIEVKQKEIGGVIYQVTQFGAKQANRTLVTLFRMLGGGVAEIFQATGTAEERIGAALNGLQKTLNPDDLESLCQAFASNTKIIVMATTTAGKVPIPQVLDYDNHFAGDNLRHQFSWLAFAIEVNFGNFLGGRGVNLADAMGLIKTKAMPDTASQSPKA